MNRKITVIRHAQPAAKRHERHLFPKGGAPLTEQGIQEATALKQALITQGLDLAQPVAISQLIRAKQTAEIAGLTNTTEYATLNEVSSGLEPDELDALLELRQVPPAALFAARKLLANPPKENIWVTHGLLIAAVAAELSVPPEDLFIPKMASISEIVLR